jgi:hypothetical protein
MRRPDDIPQGVQAASRRDTYKQHERSEFRFCKVRQHYQHHARKQGGSKGGISGGHVLRVRLVIEQVGQKAKWNTENNHRYGG